MCYLFYLSQVISSGQVNVCLPVSLHEVSVCPRNAPRPICHWLLLFSSSNWCLEVELWEICAFLSFFLSPVFLCVFARVLGWTFDSVGKVLRMVNAFGNESETCPDLFFLLSKSGKRIDHHHQVECHRLQIILQMFWWKPGFEPGPSSSPSITTWTSSCSRPGAVEIENYTSRHSSIMHFLRTEVRKKRKKGMTWLRGITSNQAHPVVYVHINPDEQIWLPRFVVMRKPQRTNASHCTWAVNRVITNGMCSFSCLFISRGF